MKSRLHLYTVITVLILLPGTIVGQNKFDALRFSQTMPAYDAATMSLGGATVTRFAGYGSFIQNPANIALIEESQFTFGISNRDVRENSTYLNRRTSFNDNQTGISNLGYLYRFPTTQGSLVVGGGYTQLADFNRASSINAFNENHTIVDFFLRDPGNQYFNTAFNAFAIEFDDDFDEYFNVLRADGNFRGMNQYSELRERGQLGEYSLMLGTEFQPNFYVGMSIGLIVGDYRYRRDFVEEDMMGRYVDAPFDVAMILNEDRINANIRGANFRVGAIYEPVSGVRLGGSFTTRTVYDVDETFSTFIRTDYYTLDADGANRYEDTFSGEFSYRVTRPSVLTAGVGISLLPFADLEVSAERVNYSRMEFNGLGIVRDRDENLAIRNDFNDVINIRAGATFTVTDQFMPRVGFAYHPSPRKAFDSDISFLSAGATLQLNQGINLDFGVQYAVFDDELDLYRYSSTGVATSRQEVNRLQAMFGITFNF
ncbi:MAG: outer membrane protein transport protein [Bacteroidetes bacterium]|nr:outer membrane protein transport protein [Bacteroidota bacterium]MCH8524793.1 outer membrane protein transport protein [Balneolales bacterium]